MEVASIESDGITRLVFLPRGAARFRAIPPVAVRLIAPEFLIAKTKILEPRSNAAKTATCHFLIANESAALLSGRKSLSPTPVERFANFAAGSPRKCAKLLPFNLQERFVLA